MKKKIQNKKHMESPPGTRAVHVRGGNGSRLALTIQKKEKKNDLFIPSLNCLGVSGSRIDRTSWNRKQEQVPNHPPCSSVARFLPVVDLS